MVKILLNSLNPEILSFKETAIMEVANFGRKYQKETGKYVYPAWFGEGDTETSNLIYEKTIESLVKGKTFYTYQNGIHELRSEISRYMNEIFNINTKPENHSVVSGGMMGVCTHKLISRGFGGRPPRIKDCSLNNRANPATAVSQYCTHRI